MAYIKWTKWQMCNMLLALTYLLSPCYASWHIGQGQVSCTLLCYWPFILLYPRCILFPLFHFLWCAFMLFLVFLFLFLFFLLSLCSFIKVTDMKTKADGTLSCIVTSQTHSIYKAARHEYNTTSWYKLFIRWWIHDRPCNYLRQFIFIQSTQGHCFLGTTLWPKSLCCWCCFTSICSVFILRFERRDVLTRIALVYKH